MDVDQLKEILKERAPLLDVAITSKDYLPSKTDFIRPAGLISNTARSYEPGEHWVCFYFPEIGPPEFFDSLGRRPEHYSRDFRNLLIVNGPTYLHNTERIQDYDSPYCGAYCLYYLVNRSQGVDYRSILKTFGNDYSANDARVVEWLESM